MRGLSRHQFVKAGEERLEYRLVSDDPSSMVLDPKHICELMASECFDIVKCMHYSRSASLTCRECPTRFDLAVTKDAVWTFRGTKMSTQGICSKCEKEKTLVAGGQCHRCKYGDWKDLSKTEVLRLISSGSVRPRKSTAIVRPQKQAPVAEGQKGLLEETLEGAKILMDFAKEPALFEKILESAKRERRPAGQHALTLLERGLTGEFGSLLKIIERVRKYPIPEGSPREVFQKTLDLISLRIEELQEHA